MQHAAVSPHPFVLRGRKAFQAGDLSAALSLSDMRLNEVPSDTDALELKAVILQKKGDNAGAEAAMRAAIAADPVCAWARNDLVLLLRGTGRRDDAETAAREAVAIMPDDAQAHLQFGVILGEKDELPAAEYHNRRALALAGPHPQILLNLGLTLYNQGRLDEAEMPLLGAHRLTPGDARIMAHISRLFEAKRDMAAAFDWLERAEAAGKPTGQDFTLVRATYLTHTGRAQEALDLIERSPRLSGPAQLERARLLDRLGRYDEAFPAMVAAKAQLSRETGARYDAAHVRHQYDSLRRFFTAKRMANLPRAKVRSDVAQPIFILGFPRSGTTMLEQMLSSHPEVSAGGELPFVHEWRDLIASLTGAAFPEGLAMTMAADLRHVPALLRDHYLARAESYGVTGCRLFTDKMPLNDIHLPLIRLAFPSAPVIRVVRHPFDIAVSMLSHHLTHGEMCGYAIETIITHLTATHALNRHYAEVLDLRVMTLKYEDFVADQDGQTRRVLGHCGLGFDPACLRFHDNPRHAPTPSYAQVTQPLNSRSAGRWKAYASFLEPHLPAIRPMIEDLGYTVA